MVRQKHFIDSHKGATPLAVLFLIAFFGRWSSPTAWLYLALHGTYGVLWVLKSRSFPDRSWEAPCHPLYGLVIWGALTLYWIAPFLICSEGTEAPAWWLGSCTALYALGVFLHFASDMQKHLHMRHAQGLLQDGLWARSRNPNYLGELFIYLGFGLLAQHWVPVLVLGAMVAAVWVPNMLRKDRSLSRHPGFAEWEARTGLIFPRIFLGSRRA